MIVCLNPSPSDFDESLVSFLQFLCGFYSKIFPKIKRLQFTGFSALLIELYV